MLFFFVWIVYFSELHTLTICKLHFTLRSTININKLASFYSQESPTNYTGIKPM